MRGYFITIMISISLLTLLIYPFPVSAQERSKQTIAISITVPDQGWDGHIRDVYEVGNQIWVLTQLYRSPGGAGQSIKTVTDSVLVASCDCGIRRFVFGKDWNWKGQNGYEFITNRDSLYRKIGTSPLLFRRNK